MYCGVTPKSRNGRPLQICLHKEETQASQPQVTFDINSFLSFTNSLAFAHKGLWYQPAPQIKQNMTNDVHLSTTIYRAGAAAPDEEVLEDGERPAVRGISALLRDVPHFLLGRVEGAHNITLHILFPHLETRGEKFQSLTHEQFTR